MSPCVLCGHYVETLGDGECEPHEPFGDGFAHRGCVIDHERDLADAIEARA